MKKKSSLNRTDKKRTILSTTTHIFRYITEYIRVLIYFWKTPTCVTVYGSARMSEDHEYYQAAVEVGKHLAENKLAVMTGGGPGLMEAVNRGAFINDGLSLGCAIKLPKEQDRNPYLHKSFTCRYFFIRKIILARYSKAFIALPGGFGTLDELFEMLNLICTGRTLPHSVILFGSKFWQPFYNAIHQHLVTHGMITQDEAHLVHITDDISSIAKLINHDT